MPYASRPSTSVNDDNIEKVKKIVFENRRVGIREVAEAFNISYGSTQHIVVHVVGMKPVATRLVPKDLNSHSSLIVTEFLAEHETIVYYVPRRMMRVITRRATMLAGDRKRGAISPASIVASFVISRIMCIGMYSILYDFGAYTSFYAYTRI